MATGNFNATIDTWINALQQYNFADLCTKPALNSWSLGQMCLHLVNDTHYYIEQIQLCLLSNDKAAEQMSPQGKILFVNNSFPNESIEGHPDNALIPQPGSKEELLSSFIDLKNEMDTIEALISKSHCKGKIKHPGFGYLDAGEWFRLAEMHFRHHLRQKHRIDDFLKNQRFR